MAKRRNRQRSIVVGGVLLRVGSQYVCWDSFKSGWFLGPRRLSEIFTWNPFQFAEVSGSAPLALFPSAEVILIQDKT